MLTVEVTQNKFLSQLNSLLTAILVSTKSYLGQIYTLKTTLSQKLQQTPPKP